MSDWNPFSKNSNQPTPSARDVGSRRALTRATEGTLQRIGRVVKDYTLGSDGKALEVELEKNLTAAEKKRVKTANASHQQASDDLKALGKAQYEKNFQKRNVNHDKALTSPYSRVLRAAQETKAAAAIAQKTKKAAGVVAVVGTASGAGAGVGAAAAAVALGASAADTALSSASAGAWGATTTKARAERDKSTRTNQRGFQEEFAGHASEEARSRAADAGKGLIASVTGGIDVSDGVEAAAHVADFALGKAGERAQSKSEEHFGKAAEYGRADLEDIDNAAQTVIASAFRTRKFQKTVASAVQKSREDKALAKIGKNFSAARSNRALGAFQETVAGAQQKSREEKALAKIGANFSAARSNRALGALQKAGSAAAEQANTRDHNQIRQLSSQFDADSGSKTLGARFKEVFGGKSTHTKLQESLRTAAAASSRADRTAALRGVQEHGATWMQKHSGAQESARGKAISSLQSGISRHIPKPQRGPKGE